MIATTATATTATTTAKSASIVVSMSTTRPVTESTTTATLATAGGRRGGAATGIGRWIRTLGAWKRVVAGIRVNTWADAGAGSKKARAIVTIIAPKGTATERMTTMIKVDVAGLSSRTICKLGPVPPYSSSMQTRKPKVTLPVPPHTTLPIPTITYQVLVRRGEFKRCTF